MSNPRLVLVALVALLVPLTAWSAPLSAGSKITIENSPGKFDFLNVDAGRHRLLASHEKDETVDVFNLDTQVLIQRVKLGPAVDTIVDPKNGKYYVSVQDDKRIAILDGDTLKEIGSIALEGETDAILFDAARRRLYVTHDNGTHLWAVDVDAAKVVATIPIPGAPEYMVQDAAAGGIYLNIKATNEVAVIDTAKATIVARWPVAPAVAPHGLAFDAARRRLYASGDNGILVALDASNGRVVGTAPITPHVDQLAFDPTNHRIYCAGPGKLSVVEAGADGLQPRGDVTTADTAKNVAIDPATHAVWTTYTDGKNSYAQSFVLPQ